MLIILIALSILGVFIDHEYAKFIPGILPLTYILIIGPPILSGPKDISKEQLTLALSQNWDNASALADYIYKFWVGFEYSLTALARQKNCFVLSLFSFVLSIWYYQSGYTITALLGILCGAVLGVMYTRVNRPLFVYYLNQDARISDFSGVRDEWIMAAMSLVAVAELFPGIQKFKHMLTDVLADDFAKQSVNAHRISKFD